MLSEQSSRASRTEKGQTLIELIIVITVGVMIVSALTFATISTLRNANSAKNQAQATKLAQESLERVRSGRDKNACIINLPNSGVNSWNGNSSDILCPGAGAIWSYQINPSCTNQNCYFTVDKTGNLTYVSVGQIIPPSLLSNGFTTVIIISDSAATYGSEKKATAITNWRDFSGDHQSTLITVLRKL